MGRIELRSMLVCCGLMTCVATAGDANSKFDLTRYVPGDVFLVVGHDHSDPDLAWLEERWRNVFATLEAAGVHRDIVSLLSTALSAEQGDQTAQRLEKIAELVAEIPWLDLISGETVLAERAKTGNRNALGYDIIFLTRAKRGVAERHMAQLVALMKQISKLTQGLTFQRDTKRNPQAAEVWSLGFKRDHYGAGPFGGNIELFRKGNVIGIVTGRATLREVLSLMSKKGKAKQAIADSPRFRNAFAELPAPENGYVFFDGRAFVRDFRSMVECVCDVDGSDDGRAAQRSKQLRGTLEVLLGLCDIIDYSVNTTVTKGHRQVTHSILRLQPGKQESPLARVFLNRKPFRRFDRYIPVNATSFSASGLVDFEALHAIVTGFLKEHIPNGKTKLAEFEQTLAGFGFDFQEDVFSWWSGESVVVGLPPAAGSPMGHEEKVFLFRVKDTELASKKVGEALEFVSALLQKGGQTPILRPAPVKAGGFVEIIHPIIAMFMRPVIGVHDNWLMIGTSSGALNQCLATAAGEAPSIRDNPRFRKEGLIPQGPVHSISFTDTSRFGQQTAALLTGLAMGGNIALAQVPQKGEAPQMKEMFRSALGIAMKLAPAMRQINFYSSESSMTTYDDKLTIHCETVIVYNPDSTRAPTPPHPPAPHITVQKIKSRR